MRSIRIWTAALGILTAGCSSEASAPNYGGEEGIVLARMIENLSEDSQPQAYFSSAAKPTPTQAKKLRGCTFELVGKPVIDGETATATVKVTTGGKKAVEPVDVEWKFVKEKNRWMIQAAPLQ